MSIGAAFAGFAEGAARGLQLRSQLDDAEQRRAIQKEQNERDQKRFSMEEKRMAEEDRKIEARREFEAQIKQIQDDAYSGKNGFEQFGYVGQPQAAIAAPGQQPQQPNPFKAVGDGMYRNQRAADQLIAERRAAALEGLYAKLGEPEKAMTARGQVLDLFDKDVERKFKAALAGAATGAPGGLAALSKVYEYVNDGNKINTATGQWDPKTMSYKGVEFLDKDGKSLGTRDVTQQMILGLAKQDGAALALFNTEQAWKEKTFGLQERQTKADETRAGAAVLSAQATASRASFLNKKDSQDDSRQAQAALVNAVGKLFPLAGKEFKEEELMGKDRQQKLDKKAADEKMMNKTIELAGLNPKVNLTALASIARAGSVNAQKDTDGRAFTMVGNTKVYLQ